MSNSNFPSWLNHALKIARNVNDYQFRVGAVVVSGGRPVARARNRAPVKLPGMPWHGLHAEAAAIRSLRKRGLSGRGASLYVARALRDPDQSPAMAKPCEACEELIRTEGFSKVVYTCDSGMFDAFRLRSIRNDTFV